MDEPAHLPALPLLKPWYRLTRDSAGIVLRYGPSVLELGGGAAARLLPALLPLLDGTRTVDEIVAELGEPARPAVLHSLEVLDARDLLIDGPPDVLGGPAGESVELLLATTAEGETGARLRSALARARAHVLGESRVATTLTELLALSGIGSVEQRSWHHGAPDDGLAVVAPGRGELDRLRTWNARALEAGAPWLQVLPFDGTLAAVGPLFVPGETACHECYLLRRNANVTSLRGPGPTEHGRYPVAPALDSVLAGIAASLAVRWLACRDGLVPGVLHAVEQAPELRCSPHVVYRVPRCPACSGEGRSAPLALWHEEARDVA